MVPLNSGSTVLTSLHTSRAAIFHQVLKSLPIPTFAYLFCCLRKSLYSCALLLKRGILRASFDLQNAARKNCSERQHRARNHLFSSQSYANLNNAQAFTIMFRTNMIVENLKNLNF